VHDALDRRDLAGRQLHLLLAARAIRPEELDLLLTGGDRNLETVLHGLELVVVDVELGRHVVGHRDSQRRDRRARGGGLAVALVEHEELHREETAEHERGDRDTDRDIATDRRLALAIRQLTDVRRLEHRVRRRIRLRVARLAAVRMLHRRVHRAHLRIAHRLHLRVRWMRPVGRLLHVRLRQMLRIGWIGATQLVRQRIALAVVHARRWCGPSASLRG
jgi:hypothetical protein